MPNKPLPSADWNRAISLAAELIKIDSTPHGEDRAEILVYVRKRLRGIESRIITPPNDPPYLIAKAGCRNPEFNRNPEFKLILSGHLDTVEAGGMQNPFSPEIGEKTLFGRGAADMKGGCAAMLQAFQAFAGIDSRRGDVYLIFTLDEETGSLGVAHALKHEIPRADLAIVGEPTQLALCIAHKGSQWFKVGFHGRACHASIPREGANAVVMASGFIQAMEAYNRIHFPGRRHALCGSPTASVVGIKGGGDSANIVPDYCEIVIDRRWTPHESCELIRTDLEAVIEMCQERYTGFRAGIEPEEAALQRPFPPLDFSPHTELIERLTRAIMTTGCSQVRREALPCWTEGALFEAAGTPAVVFGPGDLKKAHTVDECISTDQIIAAAQAYFAILLNFCAT